MFRKESVDSTNWQIVSTFGTLGLQTDLSLSLSLSLFLFLSQLSVRNKNTREKIGSLFKGFTKSFDESVILKNQKEVDPWFETEKKFLDEYHVK